MDIGDQIEDAFKEDAIDSDGLTSYLTELLVNWRQAEVALSRTISFILLSSAAFELLTRGVASEVSVIFLKITNATPLIAAVLPVVVAYLTLNLALLIDDITLYSIIHHFIMRLRFPNLHENNMHVALRPPRAVFTAGRFAFGRGASVNRVARTTIALIQIGTHLILPVSFVVYAYVRLLVTRGLGDVLVWMSLGISIILVLAAILLFFDVVNWPGVAVLPSRVVSRLNRRSPTSGPETRSGAPPLEYPKRSRSRLNRHWPGR